MEESYFACNFTKSNTPPWLFFTFFKLYKWYQIAQSNIYVQDVFIGRFNLRIRLSESVKI